MTKVGERLFEASIPCRVVRPTLSYYLSLTPKGTRVAVKGSAAPASRSSAPPPPARRPAAQRRPSAF